MWRQWERMGLGFLVFLPFFLAYWFLSGFVGFGDDLFEWAVLGLLGRKIPVLGFCMLIVSFWLIGFLFGVPYVGPFLARILRRVPFVGSVLQRKDIFDNIRKLWEPSGCGPIFVSLYQTEGLHPAAITNVFLTDEGYLAVVGVISLPPQELYYKENAVVYYGLPASEVSMIHSSLGYAAKRADLRGIFKRATIKELVERYHLYHENYSEESDAPTTT